MTNPGKKSRDAQMAKPNKSECATHVGGKIMPYDVPGEREILLNESLSTFPDRAYLRITSEPQIDVALNGRTASSFQEISE